MTKNLQRVKFFLTASTKEQLISKQIRNNIINDRPFEYSDPIKDGNKYITWFYADAKTLRRLK